MRYASLAEVPITHAPSSPRFVLRRALPAAGGLYGHHQQHRLPAQESPAALQPDGFLVRRLHDEFPGLLAHPDPVAELPQGVLTRKPNPDRLTFEQKNAARTHEERRAAGQAIAIGPVVSGATGCLRWGSR